MSSIDRHAIVARNDIHYSRPELTAPITVGNGKFAYTADLTGLQTFPEEYNRGVDLCTMAEYGWHEKPNPNHYKLEDTFKEFNSHGRQVLYAYDRPVGDALMKHKRKFLTEAGEWLYENPSRIGLGKIGLILTRENGTPARLENITNAHQHLDLWSGRLESLYTFEGLPVKVETIVHPALDMVAVHVESPLIRSGRLRIAIQFPYTNGSWRGSPHDWDSPDKHSTEIVSRNLSRVDLLRRLDMETYKCAISFSESEILQVENQHCYILGAAQNESELDCMVAFGANSTPAKLPDFSETLAAAAVYWKKYWTEGAIVDLSHSKDPSWRDLEKRIVLSQYVLAVNSATSLPPQETGLVQNSWHGKFHMEMHWWNVAHFGFWGHMPLMMQSMGFYRTILDSATATAQRQGYKGARWPKMIGPDGREAPNAINPFLVWQQPHPLYFAEMCYRETPTQETLDYWWDIVKATADFMATFAFKDPVTGKYVLGPPLNDVHEKSPIDETINTPYEIAYWNFGLKVAKRWRERMGMESDPLWDDVLANLPALQVVDGIYKAPMATFGTIPLSEEYDPAILEKTVEFAVNNLRDGMCSWSYPLTAMAAARIGRTDLAIKALLYPSVSNSVSSAGYNYWVESVPCYLPGNGALLSAIALMVGGWDGSPMKNAPGFTDDGQWTIQSDGLRLLP